MTHLILSNKCENTAIHSSDSIYIVSQQMLNQTVESSMLCAFAESQILL